MLALYQLLQWLLQPLFPALEPAGEGGVWVHAVSVGEFMAATGLLHLLHREHPGLPLLLTLFTPAGVEQARRALASEPDIQVARFPGDARGRLRRVFRGFRPRLLVIVETELWPNLILEARRHGVPLVLVNARLSPKSLRRYRMVRHALAQLLHAFDWILAQNEEERQRFLYLGAPPERVRVTGNLKYDFDARPVKPLRRADFGFSDQRPLVIFGSVRTREEDAVLQVIQTLWQRGVQVILAPRHLLRIRFLKEKLARRGLPYFLWSQAPGEGILLVDTLGELWHLYQLADLAFVGGTLAPIGGHSLIEPAYHGVPVLYGPYVFHVQDMARGLERFGGGRRVQDARELEHWLLYLLEHPEERRRMGQNARRFVDTFRGATRRTYAYLRPYLPS